MATAAGTPIDVGNDQPAPGSGILQPAPDGRVYWRLRALAAERAYARLLEKLVEKTS